MSNLREGIIQQQREDICDFCGDFQETRPYGPGGKDICFDCAQKPEMKAKVEAEMSKRLEGL